jgi:hypothetical protein
MIENCVLVQRTTCLKKNNSNIDINRKGRFKQMSKQMRWLAPSNILKSHLQTKKSNSAGKWRGSIWLDLLCAAIKAVRMSSLTKVLPFVILLSKELKK